VTIKGDVQGQPFVQSVEVELPKSDDSNPEIERMWAWKRVDQLLADARRKGEPSAVVDEIVRLCEDFSIVSEYASFIVLENDAEYQRWKIERRNLTRVDRDRRAQAEVQFAMETARIEALAKLGPQSDASRQLANGVPQTVNVAPVPDVMSPPISIPPRPDNGLNLNLPTGGSGGGAIDPISAAIGLGLASAAAAAARKRKAQQLGAAG
jgi:Ca-activated chloride channel family protein